MSVFYMYSSKVSESFGRVWLTLISSRAQPDNSEWLLPPAPCGDRRRGCACPCRPPCWSLAWTAATAAAACTCFPAWSERWLLAVNQEEKVCGMKFFFFFLYSSLSQPFRAKVRFVPSRWRLACWWRGPGPAGLPWRCRSTGRRWLAAGGPRQCSGRRNQSPWCIHWWFCHSSPRPCTVWPSGIQSWRKEGKSIISFCLCIRMSLVHLWIGRVVSSIKTKLNSSFGFFCKMAE